MEGLAGNIGGEEGLGGIFGGWGGGGREGLRGSWDDVHLKTSSSVCSIVIVTPPNKAPSDLTE